MRKVCTAFVVVTCLVAFSLRGSARGAEGADGAANADKAGKVRLVLPPVIYATPGVECNLYFDNAILTTNVDNYAFDVRCDLGLQLSERWTLMPAFENTGDHPIRVEVRDSANEVVACGESVVRISPLPHEAQPATLLIVGDSLTEASVYPRQIVDLAKADGERWLKLVGTRGPGNMPPTGDVKHEGYSGWTANAFTLFCGPLARSGYHKRGASGSPFIYESGSGAKTLDFARYCADVNGGQCPDMVTIGLGTNDVFDATDENIESTIETMFVHYDAIVDSIRKACRDTRIGVQLTTTPSKSQDGFRNYRGAGKQTRWQYRRNQHRLVEQLIVHYGGRESDNIYTVPTYLNLDAAHHFPTAMDRINARSDEVIARVTNGAHPSEAGYQQIGDAIYAWVVAMQQQSSRPTDVTAK